MNIEPVTIIAQIINFLILCVVLYFVLFKRIIQTLDKREKSIQQSYANAEKKEAEAEKKRQEADRVVAQIQKDKERKLRAIDQEIEKERNSRLESLRDEIEKQKKEWVKAFEQEWKNSMDELLKNSRSMILQISSKLVKDLANAEVQKAAVNTFIHKTIHNGSSEAIKDLLRSKGGELVVSTPTTLTQEEKQSLEDEIQSVGQGKKQLLFKEKKELGLGIELECNGTKTGWNIDEYVHSFQSYLETVEKK